MQYSNCIHNKQTTGSEKTCAIRNAYITFQHINGGILRNTLKQICVGYSKFTPTNHFRDIPYLYNNSQNTTEQLYPWETSFFTDNPVLVKQSKIASANLSHNR